MIGGVTHHMLPHLPGVPHLHVNRPYVGRLLTLYALRVISIKFLLVISMLCKTEWS